MTHPASRAGVFNARRTLALALLIAGSLLLPAPAAKASPFTTGFFDDGAYLSNDSGSWLDRTAAAGAGIVRIGVNWADVAPSTQPADPSNPAAGYDWTAIDRAVRGASARGIDVLLTVCFAPAWAEGPNRDPNAPAGTWRPDPNQLGLFAQALATRYSGSYFDPGLGVTLPRVRYYQAWNEPNLSTYLTPQWSSGAAASPFQYRSMLNAFYAVVKGIHADNLVLSAGTAPYGDPGMGRRMRPVLFMRTLLCLTVTGKKRTLQTTSCPNPAHLDAIAHHPYAIADPRHQAYDPDDAAVPDLWKLRQVLQVAQNNGRVLPAGPKRFWVTEFSWDSGPPDPSGVPVATQARWLEEAMYMFWNQGVDTAIWYLVKDAPPVPSYDASYQSGVFYSGGATKPAYTSFHFPFVADRLSKKRLRIWGRAPITGPISIQAIAGGKGHSKRRKRHAWQTVMRLQGQAGNVFLGTLRSKGAVKLRAVGPSGPSLVWSQR